MPFFSFLSLRVQDGSQTGESNSGQDRAAGDVNHVVAHRVEQKDLNEDGEIGEEEESDDDDDDADLDKYDLTADPDLKLSIDVSKLTKKEAKIAEDAANLSSHSDCSCSCSGGECSCEESEEESVKTKRARTDQEREKAHERRGSPVWDKRRRSSERGRDRDYGRDRHHRERRRSRDRERHR